MSTITLLDPDTATGRPAALLEQVRRQFGGTPNMARAMANSPALLAGYLAFSNAMSGGTLPGPVREQIALAIADSNRCQYCLAAHTYVAAHVARLDPDTITDARHARSGDPKVAALLQFAVRVNRARGGVGTALVDTMRQAGVTDEEIAETIGHVALNVLTNYFNKTMRVEIDFPPVPD
jgi:uncharacterized peroxidase-related enzyme